MDKTLLYCFPYAGGSETVFYPWRNTLLPEIELRPVSYAGRGKRFHERCYAGMDEAVRDLYETVGAATGGRPYSFFGHSMGGLIAYELCRKIVEKGGPPPVHLFLSAVKAPDRIGGESFHSLPEDRLIKKLENLNGTPKEVLEDRGLMDLFLPIIRSDFKLMEEYRFAGGHERLNCPMTVLYGEEDEIANEEMLRWNSYTKGVFRLAGYPGDHFFIHRYRDAVVGLINDTLAPR
ncbi:thioesterase II family protein [Paenibacillus nasutitermitis]|uniref:Thioesterase n=1 Tax=Paenibacillus nasutitermitis TaxID=1652958 RepID=A0A916ZIT6_9BACL|nr:thioesterase [Paenibacillus nasutitermitis]GGD98616.1 thioesterase [Paenibacillus nasutitermitis]